MNAYYKNLVAYNHWAFAAVIDAVESLSVVPETVTDLLGHAVITEKLWLRRISGATENPPPVWPKMSIAEIRDLLETNKKECNRFLDDLAEQDFTREVTYKNSSGTVYTNTIGDIVLHVCLHGDYHRGQLNKMIREFGGTPANIDYITFMR